MKRFFLAGLLIIVVVGVIVTVVKQSPDEPPLKISAINDPITQSATEQSNHKEATAISGSVFVPYWTLDNASSLADITLPSSIDHKNGTDYIMYFGVTPDANGIITDEPGYNSLSRFSQLAAASNTQTLLTIRMINTERNDEILEKASAQETIIRESLDLANDYGFEGIVLDLEHSVLPTEKVSQSITDFIQKFSEATRAQDSIFALTIYGDVFYRARPYNVKAIAPYADHIMIMTYDYSKTFGTPGPNFPLEKGEAYGYSIEDLVVELYENDVPPEKLTFIFGMYGYEWLVDDENRPIKRAEAVTLNQANSRYSQSEMTIDPISKETTVTRTKDDGTYVTWFETEESVEEKAFYLMEQGISHVGYWAWGYY